MVLHTVIGRAGIAGTLDYALSIPAKQALPPNPPAATTAWHARSTLRRRPQSRPRTCVRRAALLQPMGMHWWWCRTPNRVCAALVQWRCICNLPHLVAVGSRCAAAVPRVLAVGSASRAGVVHLQLHLPRRTSRGDVCTGQRRLCDPADCAAPAHAQPRQAHVARAHPRWEGRDDDRKRRSLRRVLRRWIGRVGADGQYPSSDARMHACTHVSGTGPARTTIQTWVRSPTSSSSTKATPFACTASTDAPLARPLPVGPPAGYLPTGHLWLRWSEMSVCRLPVPARQLVRLRGAMSHAHLQRNNMLSWLAECETCKPVSPPRI